jgi:hypothetical protein
MSGMSQRHRHPPAGGAACNAADSPWASNLPQLAATHARITGMTTADIAQLWAAWRSGMKLSVAIFAYFQINFASGE